MTLEDWAYVSQIAGVVLVVGSLIFLGLQVRQSTAQQRLEGKNKGIETQILLWGRMTETPEKSDLMRRALHDFNGLTLAERGQAQTVLHGLMLAHNALRHANEEGMMDRAEFAIMQSNWFGVMRTRGARQWYASLKHLTPRDFQDYVAATIDDPAIPGVPVNEDLPWFFGQGEAAGAPLPEPFRGDRP